MIFTNFREIDGAGRIVISKDIRNHLGIQSRDTLCIETEGDCIKIRKAEDKCVFCNSTEQLKELDGKHVCEDCLQKLKSL